MKLGFFLFKIIIVITIVIILVIIITIIVITPARPHKHDQAGGHGPALFWPLKLRRFRVHILPTTHYQYYHQCYLESLVLWYFSTLPLLVVASGLI